MSDQSDLSYKGPDKNYKSQPGSGRIQTQQNHTAGYGYGDVNRLKSNLSKLIQTSAEIIENSNNELKQFSLDLTSSDKLMSAAKATWSNFEEDKHSIIPYSYYSELENSTNRSSKHIHNEFKKALRDPNGSSAIDVKFMAEVVSNEAEKISSLLDVHMSDNKDSAEHRLVELFLEWTNDCSRHLTRLNSFFNLDLGERNKKIPKEELDSLTKNEATQYQALFTVKNNALNQEIDMKFDELKRKYLNTSDIFYSKFLGPSLSMRTRVSKNIPSGRSDEAFASAINDITSAADRNMTIGIYDTLERANDFNQLFMEIENRISLRENYNSYIRQLQPIGVSYSKTVQNSQDISDVGLTAEASINSLANTHNRLSGRSDISAHPQYLLKDGDRVTGDINILSGSKIDNVSPSLHSHSGADGSVKISGSAILNNTITSKIVDKTESIKAPHNVRVIDYVGDNRLQSAILFFHTEKKYPIYELDVKLIPDVEFIDPGQNGVIVPPVEIPAEPVIPGYIPPFEANSPLYIEWITEIDYELFFN
jgi:hypothetical protein